MARDRKSTGRARIAAAYLRVSTRRQSGDDGLSLDAQEQAAREYAHSHNLDLSSEYFVKVVESAKSAGKLELKNGESIIRSARVGFSGLIEKLFNDKNAPKVLIVQDWDRIARNDYDFGMIKEWILSKNGEVHSFRDNKKYNKATLTSEYALVGVKNVLSQDENLKRSVRIKDALRHKARVLKLYTGSKLPYGYKWAESRSRKEVRRLEVDKEQAKVVKKIYELACDPSYSLVMIWEYAISKNIWSPSTEPQKVKNLISNPLYIGGLRWRPDGVNGDWEYIYDGNNPAIVSRALFDKANERINTKTKIERLKRTTQDYAFTGLLGCHYTGLRMAPSTPSKNSRKKLNTYWRLQAKGSKRAKVPKEFQQNRNGVRDEVLKEQIAEFLDKISLPKETDVQALAELIKRCRPDAPTKNFDEEIKKQERAVSRAQRILLDEDLDEDTYELAKKRLSAAKRALKTLQEQKEADAKNWNPAPAMELAKSLLNLGDRWAAAPPAKQRAFLQRFLAAPTERDGTREYPLAVDWRTGKLTRVALSPAWEALFSVVVQHRSARRKVLRKSVQALVRAAQSSPDTSEG